MSDKIVQLIPAAGWRVRLDCPSEFEDLAAFGLTADGRIVPLVVATGGKSIEQITEKNFSIIGPIHWEMLEQASALESGNYARYARLQRR